MGLIEPMTLDQVAAQGSPIIPREPLRPWSLGPFELLGLLDPPGLLVPWANRTEWTTCSQWMKVR